MLIHQKVKNYIEENGLCQSAVAKKAGFQTYVMNALLNGRRTMYPEDLSAICYALNISAATFIERGPAQIKSKNLTDGITSNNN
jgi:antitoxin component HigA of HigAB toxin-antitoxin module